MSGAFFSRSLRRLGGNPDSGGHPGPRPYASPRVSAKGRDASYSRTWKIVGDMLGLVALLAMIFGALMFPGGM